MKKITYFFLAVLFTGILSFGYVVFTADYSDNDTAPQINKEQTDTLPISTFPYQSVFNYNFANIGGLNGGSVGAIWLNGKYFFNRWNSSRFYICYDNGPGGGPGSTIDSIIGPSNCRDLTTDGTFLYGGPASTTLYRIDPNTGWTLKTFTLSGGNTRALAWDPNRKGFWNSAFTGEIFFHDTTGALKFSIPSTLTGKYGMAFDSLSSPDSAFLWVWNQGTGSLTNELVKYHIQSGAIKAVYIFNLLGQSVGIAGGAEMVVKNNKLLLLLNFQNFALIGYKIKDLPLTGIGKENNFVESYSLNQNYPNPFNSILNFKFQIPNAGIVAIKVFNITGKEVSTLVNDYKQPGTYQVRFDAEGLSSGVYFYRMTAGEFSDVKKFVLMK